MNDRNEHGVVSVHAARYNWIRNEQLRYQQETEQRDSRAITLFYVNVRRRLEKFNKKTPA